MRKKRQLTISYNNWILAVRKWERIIENINLRIPWEGRRGWIFHDRKTYRGNYVDVLKSCGYCNEARRFFNELYNKNGGYEGNKRVCDLCPLQEEKMCSTREKAEGFPFTAFIRCFRDSDEVLPKDKVDWDKAVLLATKIYNRVLEDKLKTYKVVFTKKPYFNTCKRKEK